MSIFNKRIFGFAAVVFGILVSATAVAHTDGIYNPTANSVGDTQGIDSNGGSSAPAFDAATIAWVAQVVTNGGTVSVPRETIVDTFIKCLKTNSLFSTLDRYWLFAGENTQSALTDMRNLQSASVVGAPTFSANVGYANTSSSNYVTTNYIPSSSAVNYTQNSATVGAQVQTNRVVGANAAEFGGSNAGFTAITSLAGLSTAIQSEIRINSSSINSAANTTAKGSWLGSRTGASAGQLYFNGATAAPGAVINVASTGLPDAAIVAGAINQGGSIVAVSTDQYSSFFAGAGMNATQAGNFETCQNAMMTSIGINVH